MAKARRAGPVPGPGGALLCPARSDWPDLAAMSPRWISPCQRHSYHQGKKRIKKNNYFKNKRMNTLLEEIIVGGGKWK
jgi:hypothetical protein